MSAFLLWSGPAENPALLGQAYRESRMCPPERSPDCARADEREEVITPLNVLDPSHLIIAPVTGSQRLTPDPGEPIGQSISYLFDKPVPLSGGSVKLLKDSSHVTPLNARDPSALILGPGLSLDSAPAIVVKKSPGLPKRKEPLYEQGMSRIAPGDVIGAEPEVITPLDARDPSSLILSK